MPYSLAFRLVASAAVWVAVALAVGGFALIGIFRDSMQQNLDRRLIVVWESLVTLAEVPSEGDIIMPPLTDPRFSQTYSGWYWQINLGEADSGDAQIVGRSRSLWDQALQLDRPIGSMDYTRWQATGPEDQTLRVVGREVALPGSDSPFYILVAGDQTEVTRSVQNFATILVSTFILFGAMLLIALLIQVRFALRPLRDLRSGLKAIRDGRAERLDLPLPGEIAPLADELNALIAHNPEVVQRSRTQVGNLAHALKTPLSVIANEARSETGAFAELVSDQASVMRDQVDHYLSRARAAASAKLIGSRTNLSDVISDLTRTLNKIYGNRGLTLDQACAPGLAFRGERQDLEEVIGNVLENAFKWADSRVRISAVAHHAGADAAELALTVDDDGPGLSDEERSRVLTRGTRLDESTPGSGLGLSIVKDLVELYGGSLSLGRSDLGGLQVQVRLPLAS